MITAINPASGSVGSIVTISGSGFSPVPASNQVYFSGNVQAQVTAATATQLTVLVPDNAQTGPVTVTSQVTIITTVTPSYLVFLAQQGQSLPA